jgi:DNA (cytosine-5)-methyltransferase 1
VQADLEAQGYEVFPYVLPAAAVNAPHRRDRVWFVAHSNNNGLNQCDSGDEIESSQRGINALGNIDQIFDEQPIIKHSNSIRQKWRMYEDKSEVTIRQQSCKRNARSFESTTWENFPTKSPICNGNDGIPDRLDGITFSKWRKESIKAGGNAIVPQVAFQIFKTIAQYETIYGLG